MPPTKPTTYKSLLRGKQRLHKRGSFSWSMPPFWPGDAFRRFLDFYIYNYPGRRAALLQHLLLSTLATMTSTCHVSFRGYASPRETEALSSFFGALTIWKQTLCPLRYQTVIRNQGSVFCSSWNIRYASPLGRNFLHFWTFHKPETPDLSTILECLKWHYILQISRIAIKIRPNSNIDR